MDEYELELDEDYSSTDREGRGLDRYWRVMAWLFGWTWRNYKGTAFLLVLIGGGSTLLQGSVLGGLFKLVNSLKSDNTLEILGYTWNLMDPLIFSLAMCAMGTALAGAGAGWMLFKRITNNLSVKLEKDIVRQVFEKFLAGDFLPGNKEQEVTEGDIKQAVAGGARLSGRSLRVLLISLLDSVRLIVFLAVCLYLQPIVMIALAILMLPVGFALIKLNRRIHQNEEQFKNLQGKAQNSRKQVLTQYNAGNISRHKAREISEELVAGEEVQDASEAYRFRLNSIEYSDAIGHIGLTLGLIAAMAWLLFEHFSGGSKIAEIATFLFALRFFLLAAKSIVVTLAIFTRHYIRVREVYEIIYA